MKNKACKNGETDSGRLHSESVRRSYGTIKKGRADRRGMDRWKRTRSPEQTGACSVGERGHQI